MRAGFPLEKQMKVYLLVGRDADGKICKLCGVFSTAKKAMDALKNIATAENATIYADEQARLTVAGKTYEICSQNVK